MKIRLGLILLAALLSGCGGGTEGSGGREVRGVVVDVNRRPVEGATVRDPKSGAETVTDENGEFYFDDIEFED